MKKLILSFAVVASLISCQNEDKTAETVKSAELGASASTFKRTCASQDILDQQIAADPMLAVRMNRIEAFTQDYLAKPESQRLVNGVIEIPVVFNVLYRTAAENVSLTQLQSQLDVMNKDFGGTNTDYNSSNPYNSVRGSISIRFVIDQVIRKATTRTICILKMVL